MEGKKGDVLQQCLMK